MFKRIRNFSGQTTESITSKSVALLLTLVVSGSFITPIAQAQDEEVLEEVVVIATRLRAESVQDVPASITAIGSEMMERQQIENTSDMQMTVPNVSYSKGNFTTSSFQVRGIGFSAVGSTADSGVSVHVNEIPIESHRLYATEFFDVETISIMRGPQGTLFGRNATGGLINVRTNTPDPEFNASFVAELGDFNSARFTGHVNFPMGEQWAVRFAGISTQRDGYTTNLFTGDDIDGRDMYAFRGSLRFQPSDRTTIDLMASYMEDNSDRTRSQKTLCNRDPVGNLGCLGDRLDFDFPNGMGIFPSTPVTDVALGDITQALGTPARQGFSLFPFGYDVHGAVPNPADMRTVNQDFDPVYKADDTLITLSLDQALGDSHNLEITVARHETSFFSRTDWDATVGAPIILPLPGFGIPVIVPGIPGLVPGYAPMTYAALFSGNDLPISNISTSNLGVLGLDILTSATNYFTYDQSNTDGEQTTYEIILDSDFGGDWNYLLGGIYYDYEGSTDYNVASNTFDYFSTIALVAQLAAIDPLTFPSAVDGTGIATPFFVNETDLYGLKSTGIFGEVYWDASDAVKLTLGLRYTRDEKRVRDRNLLLNSLLAGAPVPTPLGSTSAAGLPGYRTDKETFSEMTGRFVVDWQLSDSTMLYGSYTRGYKGGGFNPPFDPAQFPTATRTFEPEDINAYEIGTKSVFRDLGLTLNLSAFYYDYEGLQIARIVSRTSFNENVDAEITGLEAEFVWAPTDNFLVNGMLSLLDTEIGNVAVPDPRDPSGGVADSTVVKNLLDSENCVILWNGSPDPATTLPLVDPAFALLPFSDCSALQANMDLFNLALGTTYSYTDAVNVDLKGNPLAGSPETAFSLGAQYTFRFGDGLELTPRVDYYWQDDSQGRIYNSPIDRIESWDNINAQITLAPEDYRWYFKVFVQNLADDDNITGMFLNSAALGLSTNVFLMEPRRYGATFGINFE